MDDQKQTQQPVEPQPQDQTFQVKVNADGSARIDDTPPQQQGDYRNNPDYVPDDPPGYDSTATDDKSDDTAPVKTTQTEADIQQKFTDNSADVQTAAQFLESKGLNYEQIVTEYAQNGRLSDDSYAKLKEAGLPRSMIDSYCAGQEALYALWVDHVQGIAGGEKQYTDLMRYASTHMSEAEKDAYDAAVNSGDYSRAKNAVQALMYRYEKENPSDGYQYEGGASGTDPVAGFATPEEAYEMQEDPRMYTDPKFQKLFQERLRKTEFLKD